MPIYMDLHILPGIKAKDVAEAPQRHACCTVRPDIKCLADPALLFFYEKEKINKAFLFDGKKSENKTACRRQLYLS